VSSDARAAGGSDADAAAKPSDHEEGITLPNGSERIQASADSNPRGPAVHDGSVMWPGPTPKGVGARSAGPGAQGARIVTDPPSAKRNGGAGASVATGAPAVVAEPGLPARSVAKPNVIEAGIVREAAIANEDAALQAQFAHADTQANAAQPKRPLSGRVDADVRAPGARIVTDPPSARRNGGAGASVATGGPAGLARPGLPLRPAAKTNVGGEASDGEAEFETDGEAAPAQFDPTKTQAKWRNRSCRFRRPSTPMCGRREQGS
jgi:hypothetical protein